MIPHSAEIRGKNPKWMITFRTKHQNGDFLLSWTGEISIAIHGLGSGFLGNRVVEVGVGFETVGDEHCVDEADGKEYDGRRESVATGENE